MKPPLKTTLQKQNPSRDFMKLSKTKPGQGFCEPSLIKNFIPPMKPLGDSQIPEIETHSAFFREGPTSPSSALQ